MLSGFELYPRWVPLNYDHHHCNQADSSQAILTRLLRRETDPVTFIILRTIQAVQTVN